MNQDRGGSQIHGKDRNRHTRDSHGDSCRVNTRESFCPQPEEQ